MKTKLEWHGTKAKLEWDGEVTEMHFRENPVLADDAKIMISKKPPVAREPDLRQSTELVGLFMPYDILSGFTLGAKVRVTAEVIE